MSNRLLVQIAPQGRADAGPRNCDGVSGRAREGDNPTTRDKGPSEILKSSHHVKKARVSQPFQGNDELGEIRTFPFETTKSRP